ncbi:hypothetical protein BN946_scf184999.g51 [Trametes cinnabarina]|uniref:Uncharacterized protein n=1 Tax=Pycnoporus cinnabarinus TaxID=5643 RepID=A0A060S7S5_PYCCI|nr:hypothetical protein BN946_scf184999.g51 [Trametes cinnabarina]
MTLFQQLAILASLVAHASQVATAPASLYIPLFEAPGMPIAADIEGVDESGHTTWRLAPGTLSGTFTITNAGFVPTATLVADATTAHLVENFAGFAVFETTDCGISDGLANCVVAASGFGEASTITTMQPVSALEVQIGGTPTVAPSPVGTDVAGLTTISSSVGTTATGAPLSPIPGSGSGTAGPSSTEPSNPNPKANGDVSGRLYSGSRSSAFGYAAVAALVIGTFAL